MTRKDKQAVRSALFWGAAYLVAFAFYWLACELALGATNRLFPIN